MKCFRGIATQPPLERSDLQTLVLQGVGNLALSQEHQVMGHLYELLVERYQTGEVAAQRFVDFVRSVKTGGSITPTEITACVREIYASMISRSKLQGEKIESLRERMVLLSEDFSLLSSSLLRYGIRMQDSFSRLYDETSEVLRYGESPYARLRSGVYLMMIDGF